MSSSSSSDESREFTEVIKPARKQELYSQQPQSVPPNGPAREDGSPKIDPAILAAKTWTPLVTRLNEAQLRDVNRYITMEEFPIELDPGGVKIFTRRKIRSRDYRELEQIRAQYSAAPSSSPQKSELYLLTFQKAAQAYLGMTPEEFEIADFEEVKRIIDAQNVRTNYGSPNSGQTTS